MRRRRRSADGQSSFGRLTVRQRNSGSLAASCCRVRILRHCSGRSTTLQRGWRKPHLYDRKSWRRRPLPSQCEQDAQSHAPAVTGTNVVDKRVIPRRARKKMIPQAWARGGQLVEVLDRKHHSRPPASQGQAPYAPVRHRWPRSEEGSPRGRAGPGSHQVRRPHPRLRSRFIQASSFQTLYRQRQS